MSFFSHRPFFARPLPDLACVLAPSSPRLSRTFLALNTQHAMSISISLHTLHVNAAAGYFNADCHAGNVLLDEETNNLSLIDYGQLIGPLDLAKRAIFARLIIAVDKKDAAMCKEAFDLLREWMEKTTGNDAGFVWKETGEINPKEE